MGDEGLGTRDNLFSTFKLGKNFLRHALENGRFLFPHLNRKPITLEQFERSQLFHGDCIPQACPLFGNAVFLQLEAKRLLKVAQNSRLV